MVPEVELSQCVQGLNVYKVTQQYGITSWIPSEIDPSWWTTNDLNE